MEDCLTSLSLSEDQPFSPDKLSGSSRASKDSSRGSESSPLSGDLSGQDESAPLDPNLLPPGLEELGEVACCTQGQQPQVPVALWNSEPPA